MFRQIRSVVTLIISLFLVAPDAYSSVGRVEYPFFTISWIFGTFSFAQLDKRESYCLLNQFHIFLSLSHLDVVLPRPIDAVQF